jgi:hypothetical protein
MNASTLVDWPTEKQAMLWGFCKFTKPNADECYPLLAMKNRPAHQKTGRPQAG